MTLPENERYEIGQKLGDVIRLLVEVIAAIEHVPPEDVFEEIVAAYIAARITGEPQ